MGEEVIPTGSGVWVHHNPCHKILIDKASQKSESMKASLMTGDRTSKPTPTANTSDDPPFFIDFTQ